MHDFGPSPDLDKPAVKDISGLIGWNLNTVWALEGVKEFVHWSKEYIWLFLKCPLESKLGPSLSLFLQHGLSTSLLWVLAPWLHIASCSRCCWCPTHVFWAFNISVHASLTSNYQLLCLFAWSFFSSPQSPLCLHIEEARSTRGCMTSLRQLWINNWQERVIPQVG